MQTIVFLSSIVLAGGLAAAEPAVPGFSPAVDANRYAVRLDQGAIAGPGGERLVNEGRAADIFMFGENHGAREIAEYAHALYVAVSTGKPRRLVTEVGPATAAELESMLRAGTYQDFLSHGVNLQSVPFFWWAEEVPLLTSVLQARADETPAIWGVDQEFMAGAPIVLKRLDDLATTDEQHEAVAATRASSIWNPFLFGMGSGKALDDLKSHFDTSANPHARSIVDQLVLGFKIYKEQADDADWKWSNERRETLMMENFLAYVSAADNQPGPLFFKLGAYHMMRGASPTVSEAFGLRVSQWATARNMTTLNVFVDCRGGELRDALLSRTVPCDAYLDGASDLFGAHLVDGGDTLFDLRPLRDIADFKQLPPRVQRIVSNYDYFLVAANTHASTFLPGMLVTHLYGGIAAAVSLAILALLTFWIVRTVRRWRRKRRPV